MSATDTVTVGRALPKLATVESGNGPFDVSVTWAAGERVGRTDIVDLAPMIFTFKVFRPLRDNPALFRSVRVAEWGEALVWPENEDLEIGAESVEEMAAEVMTNADFADFIKRNGFTLDAAAANLGIGRRVVAYYAKNRDIPRLVSLACRHIDATRGARVSTDAPEPALHHDSGAADMPISENDFFLSWTGHSNAPADRYWLGSEGSTVIATVSGNALVAGLQPHPLHRVAVAKPFTVQPGHVYPAGRKKDF